MESTGRLNNTALHSAAENAEASFYVFAWGASLIGRSKVEVMTELIVNGISLSSTNSRCPLWSYTILVSHCFWHGGCPSSCNSLRRLIHLSHPSITLLLQHLKLLKLNF